MEEQSEDLRQYTDKKKRSHKEKKSKRHHHSHSSHHQQESKTEWQQKVAQKQMARDEGVHANYTIQQQQQQQQQQQHQSEYSSSSTSTSATMKKVSHSQHMSYVTSCGAIAQDGLNATVRDLLCLMGCSV